MINWIWTNWVGFIADLIGILGALFALLAWIQTMKIRDDNKKEKERLDDKIKVVLSHGVNQIELPGGLRRAEMTRAEILGRLGMLPMKQKAQRFFIRYLSSLDFQNQYNHIARNSGDDILTIPCEKDEFDQFDI